MKFILIFLNFSVKIKVLNIIQKKEILTHTMKISNTLLQEQILQIKMLKHQF